MPLRRPCDDCEEYFMPTGNQSRYCPSCKRERLNWRKNRKGKSLPKSNSLK